MRRFLPPRFFNQVLDAFVACHHAGKASLAARECEDESWPPSIVPDALLPLTMPASVPLS
jgi:hypothetical protein